MHLDVHFIYSDYNFQRTQVASTLEDPAWWFLVTRSLLLSSFISGTPIRCMWNFLVDHPYLLPPLLSVCLWCTLDEFFRLTLLVILFGSYVRVWARHSVASHRPHAHSRSWGWAWPNPQSLIAGKGRKSKRMLLTPKGRMTLGRWKQVVQCKYAVSLIWTFLLFTASHLPSSLP